MDITISITIDGKLDLKFILNLIFLIIHGYLNIIS